MASNCIHCNKPAVLVAEGATRCLACGQEQETNEGIGSSNSKVERRHYGLRASSPSSTLSITHRSRLSRVRGFQTNGALIGLVSGAPKISEEI